MVGERCEGVTLVVDIKLFTSFYYQYSLVYDYLVVVYKCQWQNVVTITA